MLYGTRWQYQLASDLGLDMTSIHNWKRRNTTPVYLIEKIPAIIKKRKKNMNDSIQFFLEKYNLQELEK